MAARPQCSPRGAVGAETRRPIGPRLCLSFSSSFSIHRALAPALRRRRDADTLPSSITGTGGCWPVHANDERLEKKVGLRVLCRDCWMGTQPRPCVRTGASGTAFAPFADLFGRVLR